MILSGVIFPSKLKYSFTSRRCVMYDILRQNIKLFAYMIFHWTFCLAFPCLSRKTVVDIMYVALRVKLQIVVQIVVPFLMVKIGFLIQQGQLRLIFLSVNTLFHARCNCILSVVIQTGNHPNVDSDTNEIAMIATAESYSEWQCFYASFCYFKNSCVKGLA